MRAKELMKKMDRASEIAKKFGDTSLRAWVIYLLTGIIYEETEEEWMEILKRIPHEK